MGTVAATAAVHPKVEQDRTSAAEWLRRAAMGADVSFDEEPVTDEVQQHRAAERARLRNDFARLTADQRERRAEEFMERLRDLCPTARIFARSWNAGFQPLLDRH